MKAVYLRSIKSPVARQGFVFRPPQNKQMNYSDIYSQANVEQDSYELDSFCVDNEESERYDETCLTETVDIPDETPPVRGRNRTENTKARRRIIALSDSTDSDGETSSSKMTALSTASAAAAVFAPVPPLPVFSDLQSPTAACKSSFDLSREERLKKQREKQEEFRRQRMSTTLAAAIPTPASNVVAKKEIRQEFSPPAGAQSNSALARTLCVVVSSRQVSVSSEIISTLRVNCSCLPAFLPCDTADFVVSARLGVIRKLHSGQFSPSYRSGIDRSLYQ